MKNVIITGATGMVGGHLLEICLQSEEVKEVTSLVRRPNGRNHPKLKEVIHEDFTNYSNISEHLADQHIAFFCLGVYTGAVKRDLFRKITVDFPVNFAKALYKKNPEASFNLLSGQGADRTEKSRMMFAKDKGAAENQLSAIGFRAFHTFRPGYIYPVESRQSPNFSYKLMRILYKPLLQYLGKNMSIKSTDLAQAMFNVGMNGADKEVLENKDILKQL